MRGEVIFLELTIYFSLILSLVLYNNTDNLINNVGSKKHGGANNKEVVNTAPLLRTYPNEGDTI